ncbi:uncharacterized protein PV06_10670 [Exophiala oligosperma]|uniref:Zn(2)-C6 fungal-type domain-containing protein n=1 Tax=Exophiala oligosperma TaxID=215243 RepID=A0A0D2D181_9EURO|nr:uncharacterized protein PV06_10670 [Exophiala oligosperma]KIW37038.1 hypothetical protein PV06_10670 [Exophiala oligosperma]
MSPTSRHHKRKASSADEVVDELHPYKNHVATATQALQELDSSDHDTAEHRRHGIKPDQNGPMSPSSERGLPLQDPENNSPVFRPDSPMVHVIQTDTIEVANIPVTAAGRSAPTSHEANGASENGLDPNGEDEPRASGSAVPKRKRNFSNRTKTGCWTCRERKKKCGEERPICRNCKRGGFRCKGYGKYPNDPSEWPSNAPDQTMTGEPLPVDRTSGNAAMTRDDNSHLATPESSLPANIPRSEIGTVTHTSQIQAVAHLQTEARTQPWYDAQPSWIPQRQSTSHHQEQLPRLPELSQQDYNPPISTQTSQEMLLPTNQNTYPPPPSMASFQFQQGRHEPVTLPPEVAIPPPPASQGIPPQPMPPQVNPPQPNSTQPNPSQPQERPVRNWDPHRPPRQDIGTNRPPPETEATIMQSLPEPQRAPTKFFGKEDVERSKMTRSSPYQHLDITLWNERARCKRALERYNTSYDLDPRFSKEVLRNLLMTVIDPKKDTTYGNPSPIPVAGMLGNGVVIEAPFKCTYGYNLKIHQDVFIGENCNIDDAAEVEIGARTYIRCGVTIITSTVMADMIERKGCESQSIAEPVRIAEGVTIGPGAVICSGVSLGYGCTIHAFEVVKEDVGQFQEVGTGSRRARLTVNTV